MTKFDQIRLQFTYNGKKIKVIPQPLSQRADLCGSQIVKFSDFILMNFA